MRKLKFVENEIYHVYNRGADRRVIFKDKRDYLRFVHDLFEFNDETPALNLNYHFSKKPNSVTGLESHYPEVPHEKDKKSRDLLVEILIFALMPNHFHLLLREIKKGGIRRFMHKLGTGYTLHFNQRHKRVGVLFQGRFKAVHVKKNSHLFHLTYYIHTNPLDLVRERSFHISFLNSYRWSSHLDYCGWNNFPTVIQKEFLLNFFGGEEQYKKSLHEWVRRKEENVKNISDILIEKTRSRVS